MPSAQVTAAFVALGVAEKTAVSVRSTSISSVSLPPSVVSVTVTPSPQVILLSR